MLDEDDPFGSVAAPVRPAKPEKVQPPAVPSTPGAGITVKLPYPPTSNMYWRSRIVTPKGKPAFVNHYVSKEGVQFKETAGWMLRAAGVRTPFPGRVHVHIELWPSRPQDWALRQRRDPLYWADTVQRHDLDNCRKAIYDALKEIAFGDDKCVWKDSGEVMEPDGREACVIVTITPLVKENPQGGLLL